MFKLTLSPQFSNAELKIVKMGNVLSINDMPYDFSSLSDGDEIPPEAINNDFIVGGITKTDGIIHINIIMPYSDADAPDHIRFPETYMLIEDTEIIFNEKGAG